MTYKITEEFMREHALTRGVKAINTTQAKILGYQSYNDLDSGWFENAVGLEISEMDMTVFMAVNGVTGKQQKLIENKVRRNESGGWSHLSTKKLNSMLAELNAELVRRNKVQS